MAIDWSQFKDGDRIKAVAEIEGVGDEASGRIYSSDHGMVCLDVMRRITSITHVSRLMTVDVCGCGSCEACEYIRETTTNRTEQQ